MGLFTKEELRKQKDSDLNNEMYPKSCKGYTVGQLVFVDLLVGDGYEIGKIADLNSKEVEVYTMRSDTTYNIGYKHIYRIANARHIKIDLGEGFENGEIR